MKNKDTIELNGNLYSLTDGKLLLLSHHKINLVPPKSQTIKRSVQPVHHHKPQRSITLKREGVARPAKHKSRAIKAKSASLQPRPERQLSSVLKSHSAKALRAKRTPKSVLVKKFSSRPALIKKVEHLAVVHPTHHQLSHHSR